MNSDTISIEHDIKEREDIIAQYKDFRILDRDDAITKIKTLRLTDSNVAIATGTNLVVHSVPFENATNDQLVNELQMQVEILYGELIYYR